MFRQGQEIGKKKMNKFMTKWIGGATATGVAMMYVNNVITLTAPYSIK